MPLLQDVAPDEAARELSARLVLFRVARLGAARLRTIAAEQPTRYRANTGRLRPQLRLPHV